MTNANEVCIAVALTLAYGFGEKPKARGARTGKDGHDGFLDENAGVGNGI